MGGCKVILIGVNLSMIYRTRLHLICTLQEVWEYADVSTAYKAIPSMLSGVTSQAGAKSF